MSIKNIFLGISALLFVPTVCQAGAEAIHGDLKKLPPQCKSLKNAGHIQALDFYMDERDRLAKEIGPVIQQSGQPGPKQQACKNYLKATKTVEGNFKGKVNSARLKASGSANMIGQVAVLNGIRNLSPECHSAIKSQEQEMAKKEMQIKSLCK